MKISEGDEGFLSVSFFISEVDFFYLNILVWLNVVDWGLVSSQSFQLN